MCATVENGVKQFKGMFRTLSLALEGRIGVEIPVSHPLMAWLVEHTAELLAKYTVGHDGRTPLERLRGRRYRLANFEFGEQVMVRTPVTCITSPPGEARQRLPRGGTQSPVWMPGGRRGRGLASGGAPTPTWSP